MQGAAQRPRIRAAITPGLVALLPPSLEPDDESDGQSDGEPLDDLECILVLGPDNPRNEPGVDAGRSGASTTSALAS